uniref:Uncharacterized protein n=1 Tax=Strigamia maritima TaxID=126957 RepID=T1J9S6_STRMM
MFHPEMSLLYMQINLTSHFEPEKHSRTFPSSVRASGTLPTLLLLQLLLFYRSFNCEFNYC